MSKKGSRSPPAREALPERENSCADPGRGYQPPHRPTESTGRAQAEHRAEADLAALTLLHDLSTRLLAVDRLEPLLQEIMDAAVAIVGAERGTLQLIEGDSLCIVAHHGHQPAFLNFFAAAEDRASVCGEVLKRGQRVIVEDVERSPFFVGTASAQVLRDAGVRAVQSTPLRTRQGRLLGILTTQWSVPHVPGEHDLWRIDLLARQATDLIEHKQTQETLHAANEDLRVRAEQLQTTNEMLEARQRELEQANDDLAMQEQDLRQHAEALQASQERLAVAASGTRIGMYEWDAATGKALWTEQVEQLLGLRPTTTFSRQYHYQDWAERVHPEDRPRIQAEFHRCMTERAPYEAEYRIVWPDGSVHWLAGRGVFRYGSDGECTRMLGILMDITERKQAEEGLLEANQKYRALFNNRTVGLAYCQTIFNGQGQPIDYTVLDINATYEELVGIRREQIVGKRITEAFPGVSQDLIDRHNRVAVTGQESHFEICEPTIDKWFDVNVFCPQKGYFVAIFYNITARIKAEKSLREAHERVAWLARVPEENPNPVLRVSAEGTVLYRNRATAEKPGWTCEIGRPLGEPFLSLVQRALAEGRQVEQDVDVGGEFYAVWVSPVPSEGYANVYGRDITDRKRAEAALRELNETLSHRARQLQKLTLELTQAEEQERRRIAVILHEDLQQQMAGAKFHLNLVQGKVKDDRLRADLEEVGEILKGAIEQSRTLSRDLSPALANMNDLAEVLQWLAHRMRAQQGLTVNLAVVGDLRLHSEAQAMFLFRAVQEMLFNVVEHAQVREAAVRVRRIGRYVCLSVSDQGQGFDPRALKETSGVGLFSIRERTKLLRGRFTVKSAKGRGSRFRIMVPDGQSTVGVGPRAYPLPVQASPEAYSASAAPGDHDGQKGGRGGPPLRVLLVDDHKTVRAGLAAMLRAAPGIALVGEAPGGREAINLAVDLRPDVVIMDVSMPLMKGDEATRQIKRHLPQTRVIALSMYDEAEKKKHMFEAGAESYILKTISAEDLLAAIRGRSTRES